MLVVCCVGILLWLGCGGEVVVLWVLVCVGVDVGLVCMVLGWRRCNKWFYPFS